MRKFYVCFLLIIGIILACPGALAAESPEVEAKGAILMEYETGRVLWEKNSHERLPMASTTKIMTALLAIENGKLNEKVAVSKRASQAPNVQMHLVEGEELSLENLLYGLMLQSYNDAAVAIAEHIGGSVENFCHMMTEKARSLGAEDTSFQTPNGLDGERHYSTAYDLALIARYALANPEFMKLINTSHVSFASSKRNYSFHNKNRLLNEFPGAIGVKTGYTGGAGHCFVGGAQRNNMRLISVVLASGWGNRGKEQKWTDTKRILNYGFDSFSFMDIIHQSDPAGEVWVERAKINQVPLYYQDSLSLPLSKEEKEKIVIEKVVPGVVRAPVEEAQQIGVAKVFIAGNLCSEVPILASFSVDRHDLKTSMEKVIKAFLQMAASEDVKVVLPEF